MPQVTRTPITLERDYRDLANRVGHGHVCIPQRAYDPASRGTVYILVPVQQSIWTYHVGSTRFLYDLTFQEGKLIDIATGDYGQ